MERKENNKRNKVKIREKKMEADWQTVVENSWSGKIWENKEKSTGRREKFLVGLWLEIFGRRMKRKRVAQQKMQGSGEDKKSLRW